MKKNFHFKNTPIFFRLSLIIVTIFIFILLLFSLTSYNYIQDKQTSLYHSVNSNNHQAISKIDDYINDISNITTLPLTYKQADDTYMHLLNDFHTTGNNSYDFQRLNEQIFEEIFTYKKSVDSCFLFNLDGIGDYKVKNPIYQPMNPSDQDWFQKCIDAFGKPIVVDTYKMPNLVKDNPNNSYVFGVARGIVRLENASVIGILLVNTEISYLEKICNDMKLTENHRIIILHDNYTIYDTKPEYIAQYTDDSLFSIPQNTDTKLFELSVDHEQMFAASYTSSSSNWRIISLIPKNELFSDIYALQRFNIAILIISMVISLLLLFIISRQIVVPINRLVKIMKITEAGDFSNRIRVDRTDEIGTLSLSYNSLIDKVNELIHEVYLQKIIAGELELQMLQSQINPHFLYNTLESISMLATIHDDEVTAQMAADLGSILRYSISNINQQVSLGDEISQLQKYIDIQQLRFRSQYAIHIHIEQKYYVVPMPKLILQPLVENAIYHGMSSVRQDGRITISAAMQDSSTLLITIFDNGIGMSEEEVQSLNSYINGENNLFHSIGLKNVHRRIQLFCGSQYGISIESTKNKGTSVYVRIHTDVPYSL